METIFSRLEVHKNSMIWNNAKDICSNYIKKSDHKQYPNDVLVAASIYAALQMEKSKPFSAQKLAEQSNVKLRLIKKTYGEELETTSNNSPHTPIDWITRRCVGEEFRNAVE